jgi:lipoate---protein ligase
MKLLDLTLETPEENLALDEALLESGDDHEVLRFWEPKQFVVVVGNSSRLADEVELDACSHYGVPVLRRPSGGAAIVTGPGCLMYSLVLSYRKRPQLRSIDQAHRFVLEAMAEALRPRIPNVRREGISDLAIDARKFSGNSLRCKREYLLYHGTLLHHFPLNRVVEFLKMPPREPQYRQHRSHSEFVVNLPLDAVVLRQTLAAAFEADRPSLSWPRELTAKLVAEKYGRFEWNRRT